MLRVVQWGTGLVGRFAVGGIEDHPDLQLVGALVYSDSKAGRDLGDICGIGPIGVIATKDREEIISLNADCVVYMARGGMSLDEVLDDVCPLLASGKNVVSTTAAALIYPCSAGQEVAERLESACRAGGVSFHGTGIEPGWASEVLPLTMSSLFRRIESILVQELLNYASWDNHDMLFNKMGFGLRPDADVPGANPELPGRSFRAPLMLVADALGGTVDDFVFHRQVAVADTPFDIKAGRIEAGTVSAQRYSFSAVIDGRPAITIEHITRIDEGAAPEWPSGRGWKATIEGLPSMVVEAEIGVHGEDENDQACLGTAMHAVHAIAPVCAAPPGIRTFLDLPLITGRHTLRSATAGRAPAP